MGIPCCDQITDHCLNGLEAVKMVEKDLIRNNYSYCSYELILMDCNMPVMDGYDSTSKIREIIHRADLTQPIISAVTGHTEEAYVRRSILCGMNLVLSKPVSINLVRYLATQLGYLDEESLYQCKINASQVNIIADYV